MGQQKICGKNLKYFIGAATGVLLTFTHALSQDKLVESALPLSVEWSEGSILVNDGAELKGLLKYNDKNGLLSFENGSESRSFTARNVAGFEFFDESIKKQRVFFAFQYEDSQNNVKRPLFFEVLSELEKFVVLSKVDPIEVDHRAVSSPGSLDPVSNTISRSNNFGTTTEISQTETIYLMDPKGNIKPYIRIVEREVDGVFYDVSKTRNKMIDEDLLAGFIGSDNYKKLTAYAKENKLNFKRKSDLLKILEYYSTHSK